MSVVINEAAGPDRGATAPAPRRDTMFKIREVRERLISSNGLTPAFDQELIRQFAQNRLRSAPAIFLMLLVISGATVLWAGGGMTMLWLVTIMSSQASMVALAKRYITIAPEAIDPRVWRQRLALCEASSGLSWAMLALRLTSIHHDAGNTFVLFLMMLVVAMSTLLSATMPLVMYIGALPIWMVVVVISLLTGSLSSGAIALMATGALVYFMLLGGRLNTSALETLRFRSEKDALIAELEQAKANSDEARRRAEEANLAKSRFLATMSHELRTPLNAILGFSEVMKAEVFGPLAVPNYKEYVGDIHASGQHLLDLINEILDLSRIEAGRYELNEEAVQLAHVAEECHHLLKLRARSKGITIHESFETGMPAVWVDERAVRQVALNLLSNAIKFTPQGGEVTVKVGWTMSGGQYLMIKDTGPGIPDEEIPTVLASFGRGSLAIKTAEQGTGLGLPIVKGLIELHGGKFTLRSKLREGTEVIVTLPPERVMQPLAPMVEAKAKKGTRAA